MTIIVNGLSAFAGTATTGRVGYRARRASDPKLPSAWGDRYCSFMAGGTSWIEDEAGVGKYVVVFDGEPRLNAPSEAVARQCAQQIDAALQGNMADTPCEPLAPPIGYAGARWILEGVWSEYPRYPSPTEVERLREHVAPDRRHEIAWHWHGEPITLQRLAWCVGVHPLPDGIADPYN